MIYKINSFLNLSKLFKNNGFNLYLVGGTVRDILLKRDIRDFDLATDAYPSEIIKILTTSSYVFDDSFIKYGVVRVRIDDIRLDIASFRKESLYKDFRHPNKIIFVRKMEVDVKRRDFTINAMYMDDRFKVYDFYDGRDDLTNKIIRMIGNPIKRIKEDPLRILRALRFSIINRFHIDHKLDRAIKKTTYLLEKLNPDKIKEEILKLKDVDQNIVLNMFSEYNIAYLLKKA